MTLLAKSIRVLLIVLSILLALAAFEGGIQLLVGFYIPPVEMLNGIFKDYTIPGLSLGILVGGSALCAAILSIRKSKFALLATIASGLIVMFFEFVEMLVIGSPAGSARFMQIFFVLLGTVMIAVSLIQQFLSLVTERSS